MQLRELQIKNQQLQQLLEKKDAELLSLQYVIFVLAFAEHMKQAFNGCWCRELSDAAIGLKAQDVETNKVIDLAKKVMT